MGPRMKGPGRPQKRKRVGRNEENENVHGSQSSSPPGSATSAGKRVDRGNDASHNIDKPVRSPGSSPQLDPSTADLPRKGSFAVPRKSSVTANDESLAKGSQSNISPFVNGTNQNPISADGISPQITRGQMHQVSPLPSVGPMGPINSHPSMSPMMFMSPLGPVNAMHPSANAGNMPPPTNNIPNLYNLPGGPNFGNMSNSKVVNNVGNTVPISIGAGPFINATSPDNATNATNLGGPSAPHHPGSNVVGPWGQLGPIAPSGSSPVGVPNGVWMQVVGPFGHPMLVWAPISNQPSAQQQVNGETTEKDRQLDEQNRMRLKIRESRRAELMRRYMATDLSTLDNNSTDKRRGSGTASKESPGGDKNDHKESGETSESAEGKSSDPTVSDKSDIPKSNSPQNQPSDAGYTQQADQQPAAGEPNAARNIPPFLNYPMPFTGGLSSDVPLFMGPGIPGHDPSSSLVPGGNLPAPLQQPMNSLVVNLDDNRTADATGPRTKPFRPRLGKRLYGKSQPRTYGYGDIIPENIEHRAKVTEEDRERALKMLRVSFDEFKKQRSSNADASFPEHLADSAAVLANFNRNAASGSYARLMAHRQIEEEYAKQRREFHDAVDALKMPALQHPNGEWLCPLCPDNAPTHFHFKGLLRHAANHLNIKPFKCPFCFRNFRRSDTARRHQASCIQLSIAVQQRINSSMNPQRADRLGYSQGTSDDAFPTSDVSSERPLSSTMSSAPTSSSQHVSKPDNDETSEEEMLDDDENLPEADITAKRGDDTNVEKKEKEFPGKDLRQTTPSIPPVVMPLQKIS